MFPLSLLLNVVEAEHVASPLDNCFHTVRGPWVVMVDSTIDLNKAVARSRGLLHLVCLLGALLCAASMQAVVSKLKQAGKAARGEQSWLLRKLAATLNGSIE